MASLNKVILIGNTGKDAELRYLASGVAQAQFSIAVNRNTRGVDGEWTQETDWFNVVVWRELAERISQNVTKGKQVYVEGRLETRQWNDKDGNKRYTTEIKGDKIVLLGSAGGGGGRGGGMSRGGGEESMGGAQPSHGADVPDTPLTDDDIPF